MQYNYKKFITKNDYKHLWFYLLYHCDEDVFGILYGKILSIENQKKDPLIGGSSEWPIEIRLSEELHLKEEIFKMLIEGDYKNLIKNLVLDIFIKLNQDEYDYLVKNFPTIEVENGPHTTNLYYYGVFHEMCNLPNYSDDPRFDVNILIVHKLEKNSNFIEYMGSLFPNKELYDSFFNFKSLECVKNHLHLFKKFQPLIRKHFKH
jgi:hypothetical protein